MKKYTIIIFVTLLVKASSLFGQQIPEPTGQVVSDFSDLLDTREEERLARKIKAVYAETGNQLFVLTVPTKWYADAGINQFAQQVFNSWKPGQVGADNGLLLIVGGSRHDSVKRALRIHTGYAIESILTDIECSRIQKDIMIPELKESRYADAIEKGVEAILEKIAQYKVMLLKPSNNRMFSEDDKIRDRAHSFTEDQLTELNRRNTGLFGWHTCRITTDYDKSPNNGVSASYLGNAYRFDLEVGVSPWVLLPLSDSALALQSGKRSHELKINFDYASRADWEAYYFQNGYYKTVLSYIDHVAEGQQMAFIGFVVLTLFPFLVWLSAFDFSRKQKKGVYTKANAKDKRGLRIWVWTIYIVSILEVISLTFFQTGISYLLFTKSTLEWSEVDSVWILVLAVFNFSVFLSAFIKANRFIEGIFGQALATFGSGSKTYSGKSSRESYSGWSSSISSSSYSSSSSSSSSSYSSSRSSSSGSSNSGYYGGGGRSGGGGASSSW